MRCFWRFHLSPSTSTCISVLIVSNSKVTSIGPAARADFRRLYILPTPRRQRAAQATTIAPRWQTLWRQHGPFGGTLARIFGPRIWRGRRTPLGLLCTVLRNPELKPGTIPPKIQDLYNKDIDMRKLERQLRVLPDLLNSCPDIASKVTRVHTLANILVAAPLASSMFSEVDKLVRICLTKNFHTAIPVTTATGERSLSALWCIKTCLRSTMSQQRQWTPQAFLWHCAQSTIKPTRATGVNTRNC